MGVWATVEQVKGDIESVKSDILSEWHELKGDIKSVGPEVMGKCGKNRAVRG